MKFGGMGRDFGHMGTALGTAGVPAKIALLRSNGLVASPLAAMASPPTITMNSTANANSSVLPANYDSKYTATDPLFTYVGGVVITSASLGPPGAFWAHGAGSNYGTGNGYQGTSSVYFKTADADVDLSFVAQNNFQCAYRISIDQLDGSGLQATALTPRTDIQALGDFSGHRVKIANGSVAMRGYRIEFENFLFFAGVDVVGTISQWNPGGPIVLVTGDSHVAGTGASSNLLGMAHRLKEALGVHNVMVQGQGGTGYLTTTTAGTETMRARIPNEITPRNPDLIIDLAGYNDQAQTTGAIGAEVTAYYNALKAALPNVPVIKIGSPRRGVSGTGFTPTQARADAIKAAVQADSRYGSLVFYVDSWAQDWEHGTGRVGATTGDGNADTWVTTDNVHRTDTGHAGWAMLMGSGIRTALGIEPAVGGFALGDAGSGAYSGFTLSYADDFKALNIVGPSTPKARYFPTAGYGAGIRGNTTSRGTAQDVDPLWTGHNDSNRGVGINFSDAMYCSGSFLHLRSRKATAQEQAHFTPTDNSINGGVRPQITSMVHTSGAVAWYPTTNAVIIDFRASFTAKATNPAGWHPALWFFTTVLRAADGNEHDLEGSSQGLYFELIDHTGGVVNSPRGFSNGPFDYFDGVVRTYSVKMQNAAAGGTGPMEFYVDGVLRSSINADSNTKSKLITALMSSHIVNGNFNGDIYSQTPWDNSTTGADIAIDYIRVWRKTGVTHWKPLVGVADLNVAYNGTGSIVLPDATTLWGDSGVTEEVQVQPYDGYEPGMTSTTSYSTNLPTGVTYTSGTRTLAVDFSAGTGNAGRLHVVVYGYKADGSTCEPLRFAINRGPNITATSVEPTPDGAGGLTADLYYTADVGTIFPKSFTATGLPTGWSLNTTTGVLSAANTSVTGGTISVTVTNGAGQQATANLELWSPAMINSAFTWDTTNATATPNDGSSKVQFLYDIYDSSKRLAQSTSANRPLLSTTGGGDGTRRVMSTVSNGPAIRSDDAAATNVTALVAAANTSNATTGTLYACWAAKESAISTVNRILGWFKNDGTQSVSARYTTTGRGATITAAGGSQQVADQATQDTNMHVFELVKNGNSLTFTVDGAAGGSLTITQTGAITADMFILFGTQAGGAMVGQIGPGFFSNTIPGAADRVRARQWVGKKMGVTVV